MLHSHWLPCCRRFQERCHELHRKKLNSIKACVDNKPPPKYVHLIQNLKKQQMDEGHVLLLSPLPLCRVEEKSKLMWTRDRAILRDREGELPAPGQDVVHHDTPAGLQCAATVPVPLRGQCTHVKINQREKNENDVMSLSCCCDAAELFGQEKQGTTQSQQGGKEA